ncbi:MAG TPA: hypothetical protein PKZ84_10190 [Anaerolineae bacterium]|nr:hypothetical protein [Anaerolineae bacterium]HQI84996.1 hypothetical protein [Anaerolineae bacterium]
MDDIKSVPLPGLEETLLNPLEEAQLKSLEARRIFEASSCDADPWMDDYWALLGEGYTWRQAVYMLWAAQPTDKRVPRTQGELATQILGLASDRAIREWKRQRTDMDARIADLVHSVIVKNRARVLEALVESAASSNPRAHADRRMFLEMSRDYTPKQMIGIGAISAVPEWDEATLRAKANIPGYEADDEH